MAENWKDKARKVQKNYYLAFEGRQWDEYKSDEIELFRVKICYALYGPPDDSNGNLDKIEKMYSKEQREAADVIKQKICSVHKSKSLCEHLNVGIIFVYCKYDQQQFCVPIFRLRTKGSLVYCYIDSQQRVYDTWGDWLRNNTLPGLEYCYPKFGFYSCSTSSEYKFDRNIEPALEFGESPANSGLASVCKVMDVASSVTAFASAGIAITSMFTPVGPILLGASAISGGVSAIWGTGRSVGRLIDKISHDENLVDLETAMLSLSILAAPLHVATATTNAAISAGARSGRIFTSSTRIMITVLNTTTLSVDSALMMIGIVNLIEKQQKGNATLLDYAQFSVSVFFFTNTLIQPKTASGIIKQAQQDHFREYQNNLSDAEAKQAFDKFVNDNNKDMRSGAKVCKTINRINDPDSFFKTAHQESADITLGGRSGKTVFINGEVRVNPNRFNQMPTDTGKLLMEATKQYKQGTLNTEQFNKKVADIRRNERIAFENVRKETYKKVANAMGVSEDELKNYKLNNKKIFENLKPTDIDRLGTVLGDTARNYNPDIIETALAISTDMKCGNVHDFMAIVEIVATECAGKSKAQRTTILTNLRNDSQTRNEFVQKIQTDCEKVNTVLGNSKHKFKSTLQGVYHYRKHGGEFGASTTMKVYFDEIPKDLFQERYIVKDVLSQDGSHRVQTYANPADSKFGVLNVGPDGTKVATVFSNKNFFANWNERLPQFQEQLAYTRAQYDIPPPQIKSFFNEYLGHLALHMGYASVEVGIFKNGKRFNWEEFSNDGEGSEYLKILAGTLSAIPA